MNKENQVREFVIDELLSIDVDANKLSDALNVDLDKMKKNEMNIMKVLLDKTTVEGGVSKAEVFREVIYKCNPQSIMEIFMLGAMTHDALE